MRIQKWFQIVVLTLMLSLIATPVAAAQGGGVHFGDYVLAAGDTVSGDLVVFGSVTLKAESTFNGDLAVFGELVIEAAANLDGDLTAFGGADIAGVVDGSAFIAGDANLRETARIEGDISVAGQLDKHPNAVIEGTFTPAEDGPEFTWEGPFAKPIFVRGPRSGWVVTANPIADIVRALATLVIMGLFAMLLSSVWPKHLERTANTVVDAPLVSLGIGSLALIVGAVVVALLIVTICLALFGFIGIAIGAVAIAFGWVAMGYVVGEKVIKSLFREPHPGMVLSALVGTLMITLLSQLVSAVSCLGVLVWPFYALAAGAVVLTRFGTLPYAVRGSAVATPLAPAPTPAPSEPAPAAPEDIFASAVAPLESVPAVDPLEPVTSFDFSDELPSPNGEA